MDYNGDLHTRIFTPRDIGHADLVHNTSNWTNATDHMHTGPFKILSSYDIRYSCDMLILILAMQIFKRSVVSPKTTNVVCDLWQFMQDLVAPLFADSADQGASVHARPP